ncbi:hypothetical protein PENDEC_c007G00763 [Penicillium decumbens]|uniref:Uncharacterized protein n=1 Tax=Penicillium decumbens TaxID=69771 RepID=A0A1V6PE53_PENDC|nr:hypothetical protein PENDEC_c007G00763 [Penicillium decumbens]
MIALVGAALGYPSKATFQKPSAHGDGALTRQERSGNGTPSRELSARSPLLEGRSMHPTDDSRDSVDVALGDRREARNITRALWGWFEYEAPVCQAPASRPRAGNVKHYQALDMHQALLGNA